MVDTVKYEESVLWAGRLAFQASLSFGGLLPLQEPGTVGAARWAFRALQGPILQLAFLLASPRSPLLAN